MKSEENKQFELLMSSDLQNVEWNEELELYEDPTTQLCWLTFLTTLTSAKLINDCMIDQIWFMKGTPVANLIKHAEGSYQAEAIAQNSKIKFGTDDNKEWFAHDVPFFDTVQINRIDDLGHVEWDIYFNECWQGPFDSKSRCIKHLEECIQEQLTALLVEL